MKFFKILSEKGCNVVQSNSDSKFINDLYHEYKIYEIILANRNINSKISQRGKIQELLIRSYKDE